MFILRSAGDLVVRRHFDISAMEFYLLLHRERGTGCRQIWNCCPRWTTFCCHLKTYLFDFVYRHWKTDWSALSNHQTLIDVFIASTSSSQCMRGIIGVVCDCMWGSVCVPVCTLKGNRLELSTPNLVHIYSMAGPQHVLTLRSKGKGLSLMLPNAQILQSSRTAQFISWVCRCFTCRFTCSFRCRLNSTSFTCSSLPTITCRTGSARSCSTASASASRRAGCWRRPSCSRDPSRVWTTSQLTAAALRLVSPFGTMSTSGTETHQYSSTFSIPVATTAAW